MCNIPACLRRPLDSKSKRVRLGLLVGLVVGVPLFVMVVKLRVEDDLQEAKRAYDRLPRGVELTQPPTVPEAPWANRSKPRADGEVPEWIIPLVLLALVLWLFSEEPLSGPVALLVAIGYLSWPLLQPLLPQLKAEAASSPLIVIALLLLLTRPWFWVFLFLAGCAVALFAMLASAGRLEILEAMRFCLLSFLTVIGSKMAWQIWELTLNGRPWVQPQTPIAVLLSRLPGTKARRTYCHERARRLMASALQTYSMVRRTCERDIKLLDDALPRIKGWSDRNKWEIHNQEDALRVAAQASKNTADEFLEKEVKPRIEAVADTPLAHAYISMIRIEMIRGIDSETDPELFQEVTSQYLTMYDRPEMKWTVGVLYGRLGVLQDLGKGAALHPRATAYKTALEREAVAVRNALYGAVEDAWITGFREAHEVYTALEETCEALQTLCSEWEHELLHREIYPLKSFFIHTYARSDTWRKRWFKHPVLSFLADGFRWPPDWFRRPIPSFFFEWHRRGITGRVAERLTDWALMASIRKAFTYGFKEPPTKIPEPRSPRLKQNGHIT